MLQRDAFGLIGEHLTSSWLCVKLDATSQQLNYSSSKMIKIKSKWKSLLYIINIEYNWIVSSSTNKTKGLDLYFLSQLQFDVETENQCW